MGRSWCLHCVLQTREITSLAPFTRIKIIFKEYLFLNISGLHIIWKNNHITLNNVSQSEIWPYKSIWKGSFTFYLSILWFAEEWVTTVAYKKSFVSYCNSSLMSSGNCYKFLPQDVNPDYASGTSSYKDDHLYLFIFCLK